MNNYDEIRVKESFSLKIKRFFFVKLKDKNFLKGISTVIGAAFINFIAGSIFAVCQLLLYEISYIKWKNTNSNISIDNEAFYYPTVKITQHVAELLCGIIYKKIGLHFTNLIGIGLLFFGYLTLYLSKSLGADIISMIFGGIGTGIIYYPSTANACEWFMNNNGVVIGIIETMISLGSFFFNLLGEKIVGNAEEKGEEKEEFYTLEEGKKFKSFILYLIIFVIVMYIISFLLTFKKTKENFTDSKDVQAKLLQLDEDNEDNFASNENKKNEDGNSFDQKQLELIGSSHVFDKKNLDFKTMLLAAIKSKELIIFTLIVILEAPLTSTIFALYQAIGKINEIDRKILNSIGPINFIFECLSGFIFGLLCDYVSKKNLLLCIFGFDIIIGYFYCLTFKSGVMFFIFTNLSSFTSGGFYSIKDYYLIRVFGVEVYVTIIAYVNFCASIIVLALTPLTYYLEKTKIRMVGYWIMFIIFGTCSVIGFVLSLYTKEESFNYEKVLDENKEKEENSL